MTTTTQKPLDLMAYLVLALMGAGIAACIFARAQFSEQATNAHIGWLTTSDQHELWLTTPDHVHIVDANGHITRSIAQNSLNIPNPIADLLLLDQQSFWARDTKGYFYQCHLQQLPCQTLDFKGIGHQLNYSRLTLSPDKKVITLTDNAQGKIYSLNRQGEILGQSSGMLIAPNKGLFTDKGFIQTDTGNYQLLTWPYKPHTFEPDFNSTSAVVLKTSDLDSASLSKITNSQELAQRLKDSLYSQPYQVLQTTDKHWWILEGPMLLKNGFIRHYNAEGKFLETVKIPLKDPISFTQLDNENIVIADMSEPRLTVLNYNPSTLYSSPLLTISNFGDATVADLLHSLNSLKKQKEQTAQIFIFIIPLLPILAMLWLWRQGYNLNARI